MGGVLHIAEIPYPSGGLKYRYSRYLSDDGTRWIRHGLFCAYHEHGALMSEGTYSHGLEAGAWSDFHPNGQLAAQGFYKDGVEVGVWYFWNSDGASEPSTDFDDPTIPRPTRRQEGE